MGMATSAYSTLLVKRSCVSKVASLAVVTSVAIVEASRGMSVSCRDGMHCSASGLSGVSCTNSSIATHERNYRLTADMSFALPTSASSRMLSHLHERRTIGCRRAKKLKIAAWHSFPILVRRTSKLTERRGA